jgi:hypothetical protein
MALAVESIPFASRRRGDLVGLPAAWMLRRPEPGYVEYWAHVRFENEASAAKIPMGFISKPFRRMFLEPRAGGSYRWRASELPFRGLCPISSWPVGEWLNDTLQVQVPTALLPGRYVVRISIERGTLNPVLTPADLFQDHDRFSGPVTGTLEIS